MPAQDVVLSGILYRPVLLEKQAGIGSGVAKLFGTQLGRTAYDWVAKPFRGVLGWGLKKFPIKNTAKGAKPTNLTFDQNTGDLLNYAPVKGHGVRNAIGRLYNNIPRADTWLNDVTKNTVADLNKIRPNLGHNIKKGIGVASGVGLGGGLVELPFQFTGDPENNGVYNALHTVNNLNPFYHLYFNQYSPLNKAWEYMTPAGLTTTAAFYGLEKATQGMTDAAEQGAQQAIANTADELGNMGFAERLGFLFSPGSASDKYRSMAMDRLAKTMAQVRGTGDPYADAAMRDIYKTSL